MQNPSSISPFEVTEEVWMVPCFKDTSANAFQPLCKPFAEDINWERLQCRQIWQVSEDEALRGIVSENGPRGWSRIAKELNVRVHKGMPVRQGKQCRERYYNHIDPQLVKGQWTDSEDIYILKQQREIGNKWSLIAKALPGRTENQIKNRFKSLLKQVAVGFSRESDPVLQFILDKEDICVPRPAKIQNGLMEGRTMRGPSIGGLSSAFSR